MDAGHHLAEPGQSETLNVSLTREKETPELAACLLLIDIWIVGKIHVAIYRDEQRKKYILPIQIT